MDNRHALIVDCQVTQAVGTGERDVAKSMAADRPGAHQNTLGADKGYDTKGFVAAMRRIGVTPHVAQNTARLGGSAIDGRTTRHEGYAKSINARTRHRDGVCLDQAVGWSAPAQTERHRKGERCVWSARDRLQPDPPRGDGGSVSNALPRGVANCTAKSLKTALQCIIESSELR